MNALPSPLVMPDVDLSSFEYMPLDVRRLRDSNLAATANGEEFRAAVILWCASWHQRPAASLPDNDVELAQLAGYGRVVKEWKKVRGGALHGWIKCSDGRFYHPVIAEKAIEGWDQKRLNTWERECDRIRKENKRLKDAGKPELPILPRPPKNSGKWVDEPTSDGSRNSSEPRDGIPPETVSSSTGTPPENALKGTELNGTDIKEEVVVGGARDPTAPPPDPEKASAVAIIEAFDQARASAHGESRRRPWPQARDFAIAVSWVKAGATAEIIMPVFEDLCRRKAGSGEDPIDGLVYFQKIIPKFLSDISKPMPEANPHGTNTRPISARDSRVSTDAFRGALAEVFADVVDDGGGLAGQCSADTSFGDS